MVLIYDTKKVAQTYIDQLGPEKLFRYCKKKEMVKYRSLTNNSHRF